MKPPGGVSAGRPFLLLAALGLIGIDGIAGSGDHILNLKLQNIDRRCVESLHGHFPPSSDLQLKVS